MPTTLRLAMHRLVTPISSVLVAGFIATLFIATGFAGTAHAADGYRYWNYFHLQGDSWEFSQVGAGDYQPEDGDVEGYRFGTSTTAAGIAPRADLGEVSFASVCAESEAADGEKRVAVVLDYGTVADSDGATPPSPRAECVVVAENANGLQVLQVAAEVRAEKSLTCAIDGYPAKGCGAPVANAEEAAAEQPVSFDLPDSAVDASDSSASGDPASDQAGSEGSENEMPWLLVGAAVLVLVIAGGGVALGRRRKNV